RGFEMDLAAPLIVAVSRIREQKGMDWVLGASKRILRSRSEGGLGALLSVVGTGNAYLENEFSDLETEAPGRFKFLPLMGRKIVLETLSAADIGLVPSRFEPAGMIQQQMKRYGVVPVVRATGGLISTVADPDEFPGQGTGFRFGYLERLTQADMERVDLSKDLYLATARAANLYSYAPEGFTAMQKRAMKSVRSWDEVVPEYMEVYKGALANRFAFTGRSEVRAASPFLEATKNTSRSEMRKVSGGKTKEFNWVEANTPRVAKHHLYSRQWECGLPMDLLEKIEKLYDAYTAGEISMVTLTGGLGALMPDLFEAWAAIGMNVTGIHPLWNFIKNTPLKGVDAQGLRKLLGKIAKEQMEDTGIKFDVSLNIPGSPKPRVVSFRVYKTQSMVHKAPQYYLDAYTTTAEGKEEPAFLEVYDDAGKREIDMAFFSDASERLIQILEKDPNPGKVVLIDHEVFVS
ncbi:MAG: glycosyltransferase, partial [Candidatus Omnitrophica bacterium]|nr:glycosyltransferase [Candidatus Omnitrophota bacterium]